MQDFLSGLNEPQRAAVENITGPCMVIAGAGSGKTRVITYRIANLLHNGVRSSNVLALTFTNKAAAEMKVRIGNLIGDESLKNLWIGTFHSLFAKILRFEAEHIGFTSNFTIYDTTDSKNLVKKIIKELHLDPEQYPVNEVYNIISRSKNNLLTAEAYFNNKQYRERDRMNQKPEIGTIFRTYAIRCRKADAMDFDDLLLYTNILFRDNAEVLAKYQDRFRYILVDEYQDTNYAQYLIVKKLSAQHHNLCVVGDDAQSIYSFRGAQIENILNFKDDYPEHQVFKLEQNYRSTQIIVNAANSIIRKNKNQLFKNTFSANDPGSRIRLFRAANDSQEGFLIANDILSKLQTEKLAYRDFAILYRTNAQSRIFEESLNKLRIPCKIHGGVGFFQRKEVKDVLAYIRVCLNQRDEEALERIINYPARGIGDTTVEKLQGLATSAGISVWEVLVQIEQQGATFNSGTINKLRKFRDLICGFVGDVESSDAFTLSKRIVNEAGIVAELTEDKTIEGMSRRENIEELLNGMKEFCERESENRLSHYIEKIALLTDLDESGKEDNNKVSLMTVHSAKGLEFKHCYIVGMEENMFPSTMTSQTEKDLEEERRLFYVAITRAEETASLSYALSRRKWGQLTSCTPSRFLDDIDPLFIEDTTTGGPGFESNARRSFNESMSGGGGGFSGPRSMPRQPSVEPIQQRPPQNLRPIQQSQAKPGFMPDNLSKLAVGSVVEHESFGLGKVVGIEGEAPNSKAIIQFTSAGEKTLLLKFARLRIVK